MSEQGTGKRKKVEAQVSFFSSSLFPLPFSLSLERKL